MCSHQCRTNSTTPMNRFYNNWRKAETFPRTSLMSWGYSRQYVRSRLQRLKTADYAVNLGGSPYHIANHCLGGVGVGTGPGFSQLRNALCDDRDAYESVNGDDLGEALSRFVNSRR
jgi:hypothetical protein